METIRPFAVVALLEDLPSRSEASQPRIPAPAIKMICAESRSAALQFFENNENGKNETGVSELLTGEGDSIAVPFPRPHPLLQDTRTSYTQAEAVNKKVVPP